MDQLDTMPMVPEEMEFYSGIGDEKSVGAEKSPMTIPTVPPVPDGENPFEDTDEPEADFFHCATDSNVMCACVHAHPSKCLDIFK